MLNCIISPPRTDGYFERGDTRPNVSVVLATFLRINVTGQATGKLSIFAGASGSPVIPPAKAFSILDHEENATNTPRSKSRNAHTLAHASAFTRRWGVTTRATRERRSRRHCKFHGGLSIRRELVSKAHQSRWWTKHDRARVYTRGGLSIFANFLPSHSIARCLWPTPLIVVARQQSISAHDIRTQPRLRILRVCLFFFYFSFFLSFFFFFFLSFLSPARLLHDWSTLSYCRFHGCLRNVRPRIDSLDSYGTGEKRRDRAKLLPRELCFYFFLG